MFDLKILWNSCIYFDLIGNSTPAETALRWFVGIMGTMSVMEEREDKGFKTE
jgi:hypothetical protein